MAIAVVAMKARTWRRNRKPQRVSLLRGIEPPGTGPRAMRSHRLDLAVQTAHLRFNEDCAEYVDGGALRFISAALAPSLHPAPLLCSFLPRWPRLFQA